MHEYHSTWGWSISQYCRCFFGFFAISGFVLVKLLCLKDECSLVPDAEVLWICVFSKGQQGALTLIGKNSDWREVFRKKTVGSVEFVVSESFKVSFNTIWWLFLWIMESEMDDTARFCFRAGLPYDWQLAAMWAHSITLFLSQVCTSQAHKVSKHLWDGDFTNR